MPGTVHTIQPSMRGLVGFLVFLAVALAAVAYVGVYVLLPSLVTAGVRSSAAFAGQTVSVQVRTSVGGVLLHGWIDEVSIQAAGLREPSMIVDTAEATLTHVSLTGQTFASIDGTLQGISLLTASGSPVPIASMRLTGSDVAIQAVGEVSTASLQAVLESEVQSVAAAHVTILPTEIRLDVAGEAISARLLLNGGTLLLDAGRLGRIDLVRSASDGSWTLTSVAITPTGAELSALIRPSVLGIGR